MLKLRIVSWKLLDPDKCVVTEGVGDLKGRPPPISQESHYLSFIHTLTPYKACPFLSCYFAVGCAD